MTFGPLIWISPRSPSASSRPRAIDDAGAHAQGKPRAADAALARIHRIAERHRRALGQPHRLDDGNAEARLERALLVRRQRRGRRARVADAARGLALRRREVRAVEQVGDDRRHEIEPRRPVALDERPPLRRAEAMRHHDAAAGHQRGHRRDALAVDVIERQRRQDAIGRRKLLVRRDGAARVEHVRVREQHALGHAGGARRVHEQRRRSSGTHGAGARGSRRGNRGPVDRHDFDDACRRPTRAHADREAAVRCSAVANTTRGRAWPST